MLENIDIKLSKAQSDGFLGKMIGYKIGKMVATLGRKSLLNIGVSFAENILSQLTAKATSSVIDNSERKMCGSGAVRPVTGFTKLISSENMDNIIIIIKLLEDSGETLFMPIYYLLMTIKRMII